MRKTLFTHFFTWCLVLGFAFTLVAQDQELSSGKIPSTKGEVNYWYGNNTTDSETAYGWASQAGNFISFPVPEGTPLTAIAPMVAPGFLSSACFGPTGILYFTDTSTFELYTVDMGTGALTLVGSTGTDGLNGITYDHSTGLFYAVSGTNFYVIDVTTGATTLVGALGSGGGLMIDVAAACDGSVYGYDIGDDNFYSINPGTGAATLVGPIGFNGNFGQGLSFDYNSGILYMSAFDGTGFTGQLRSVDLGTGATTVLFDWGLEQIAPFAINTSCGAPCPVGQATSPSPANGATDVPVTGNTATWVNGSGATSIEVFFNGASVYSGAPITSLSLASVEPFNYATTYSWRVDGSDGSCTTAGATWTFTTIDDPNLFCLFMDDFEAGDGNWTITTVSGCPWSVVDGASFGYTLPATSTGNVMSSDADACGSSGGGSTGDITLITAVDATLYQTVWVEFDNDWQAIDADDFAMLDVSVDGGATWTNVLTFDVVDIRNTHEVWTLPALSNILLRFSTIQPGWDWWWAIDNVAIYGTDPVPVELSSFAANVNDGNVTLNWSTATETNNQGFEIQRSSDGVQFAKVGYVAGHGTVTEVQNYVYTDNKVEVGTYSYRLKQIDFGGTFEYSNVVEVEVGAPAVFSLNQNYPNPFNPSTVIEYALAVDSKVTLTVFDVLGQEVATLVNGNIAAGIQKIDFDASSLNSGVYFYRIDATGVDGTNFSSIKKMILTK